MKYFNEKHSKVAEMSIYAAIFCFTLLIIVIPVFEYITSKREIELIESNVASSLSDVTIQSSINNYDNLKFKSEENLPLIMDEDKHIEAIFSNLGYTKSSNKWKNGDNVIYDVSLDFDLDTYYFELTYKLDVPYRLLGKRISDISVQKFSSSALVNKELELACMHEFFELYTDEPTCFRKGKTEYICKKCGLMTSRELLIVSHKAGVECAFCGKTESVG